ncbi:MAG: sulfotransferase [Woeseiaceae bacterium]
MLDAYLKDRSVRALEARLPNDLDLVKKQVSDLVTKEPTNTQALWVLARCQMLGNESDAARETLEALLEIDPGYAPAIAQLARLMFDGGDVREAIRLLTRATSESPEIAEYWGVLGEFLKQDGQADAGEDALRQYSMIKAFNGKLQEARQAFAKGDYKKADGMCRQLLKLVPNEIRVLRLLSRLAGHFHHYEFARSTLATCIETRPRDPALRLEYAQALLGSRRYGEALAECDKVIELAPEMLDAYDQKAELLYHLGRYDEAIRIYRELAELPETRSLTLLHLGKVLKTVGEVAEAEACFQRAADLEQGLGQAYWELANLKTYRFSNDEVAAMRQRLETGKTSAIDKILVRFALGKALEDAGEFAESFDQYQLANSGYLATRPFKYVGQNDRFTTSFTKEFFAARTDQGLETSAPIFVVGMPRSGSTLVEQILSSHSQVDATQELDEIVSIARDIGDPGQGTTGHYPQCLTDLSSEYVGNLAQRYLDFAQGYRRDAPFFIDKAPHNFQHIGLIKTLFPNAKIVDVRRNPLASGWSLYRQFFADSYLFSYDLETIGRYYNDYVALMEHWHAVLPDQVLTVRYEDLVDDLPGAISTILDYCGLGFEDACLNFHLNERAVATPSSEQVRQPLYRDALEHWRNYEAYLEPLIRVIDENASSG